MGYLSFDASVKIHYSGKFTSTKTGRAGHGGVAGYIRHIDRGTDRRNGCEVQHSNPDINPDFTLENESFYKDSNGDWKKTDRSSDMVGAIESRIEYARKHGARISTKGQNDTVVVRPLVVQLGSDVVAGHEDTWAWDAIGILEGQFGKGNITGFSIHRDETNVHIHAAFVPCHETEKDGETKAALSQTKFFKNPKQLAGIHKKIRKSLLDKGYEIEQENKPIEEQLAGYYDRHGGWHQQGLTPDHLKELTNRELELKVREIEMKLEREEISQLEQAMRDMQQKAKERQEALEDERKMLAVMQGALNNDKAAVQAQMQALINEKAEVRRSRKEAEEMLEKALSTADVCSQILSDEKKLNKKFLEFLDEEGTRTKQPVREYVEGLYKRFQKRRRDSTSAWHMEMARATQEHRRMKKLRGGSGSPAPDIIETSVLSEPEFF